MLGLSAAAEGNTIDKVVLSVTIAIGVPVYEVLKYAALKLRDQGFEGAEKFFRSNPGNPVSEPGEGWKWAYAGLRDGVLLKDSNKGVLPRTGGHGLKLRALDSDQATKDKMLRENYHNSTDFQLEKKHLEIQKTDIVHQNNEADRQKRLAEEEYRMELEVAAQRYQRMEAERRAAEEEQKRINEERRRQQLEADERAREEERQQTERLMEQWRRMVEPRNGPIFTPDVSVPSPQQPTPGPNAPAPPVTNNPPNTTPLPPHPSVPMGPRR